MLTFTRLPNANFLITETLNGFKETLTQTTEYSYDLLTTRVNSDPFMATSQASKDWFNKHYKSKFNT